LRARDQSFDRFVWGFLFPYPVRQVGVGVHQRGDHDPSATGDPPVSGLRAGLARLDDVPMVEPNVTPTGSVGVEDHAFDDQVLPLRAPGAVAV
jgi:hypothetical protein